MYINGLGTATPPHAYSQEACWEALCRSAIFERLAPRAKALLKKVLKGKNGIRSRYLAFDHLDEAFDLTPDAMHRRFEANGPAIADKAARRALDDAGVEPAQLDGISISTCTGYLCPGLTSYLIESLGLPTETVALDLVGQGCGGAVPNLQAAEGLLASGRCQHILSICVEICSAAFYLDDDPGVLISACLFGDGAGAAVLSQEPPAYGRSVTWHASKSRTRPEHREDLRFDQKAGLLRNRLYPTVPTLAAHEAKIVLDRLCEEEEIAPSEITHWILHAGGRDVLDRLLDEIGLQEDDLAWSRQILRDHGNLSSPFVLFVLEAALRAGAVGGWWWLASFGAGFSSYGALLKVQDA